MRHPAFTGTAIWPTERTPRRIWPSSHNSLREKADRSSFTSTKLRSGTSLGASQPTPRSRGAISCSEHARGGRHPGGALGLHRPAGAATEPPPDVARAGSRGSAGDPAVHHTDDHGPTRRDGRRGSGASAREHARPQALDVHLRLVMVVPTLETVAGEHQPKATFLPGTTRVLLDVQEEQATAYLEHLAASIRSTGVPTFAEVRRGAPVAQAGGRHRRARRRLGRRRHPRAGGTSGDLVSERGGTTSEAYECTGPARADRRTRPSSWDTSMRRRHEVAGVARANGRPRGNQVALLSEGIVVVSSR